MDDKFSIIINVISPYGTYKSEIMYVTYGEYNTFVELSKSFWITDTSFNIWTDKGVVIFPPEIAKQSILIIEKV